MWLVLGIHSTNWYLHCFFNKTRNIDNIFPKLITTKAIQEARDAVANVERPMRYATRQTEPIAKAFFLETSRHHMDFMRAFYDAFPNMPSFDATRRADKSLTCGLSTSYPGVFNFDGERVVGYYPIHVPDDYPPDWPLMDVLKGWGITACHHEHLPITKDKGDDNEFRRIFGKEIADKVDEAADEFVKKMVGDTPGFDLDGTKAATWDKYIWRLIQRVYRAAYNTARKAWKYFADRSRAWANANPWIWERDAIIKTEMEWVAQIGRNGFKRVTSSITKEFLGRAKRKMVDSFLKETPWTTIARDMNREFGTGGLWHWQRLVRSEMADAIPRIQTARYKTMGVKYVRHSASHGRCDTCDGYATGNGGTGIYKIDNAPDIIGDTHPNCRCHRLPIFRLTKKQAQQLGVKWE